MIETLLPMTSTCWAAKQVSRLHRAQSKRLSLLSCREKIVRLKFCWNSLRIFFSSIVYKVYKMGNTPKVKSRLVWVTSYLLQKQTKKKKLFKYNLVWRVCHVCEVVGRGPQQVGRQGEQDGLSKIYIKKKILAGVHGRKINWSIQTTSWKPYKTKVTPPPKYKYK